MTLSGEVFKIEIEVANINDINYSSLELNNQTFIYISDISRFFHEQSSKAVLLGC
jgi:hypothetical protein